MRCFLRYVGILFIVAGVVLLVFYNTQNRIRNIHFVIAGCLEIFGLIVYITTNRYISIKNKDDQC